MKLLFPDGKASENDIEEILKFAFEGRKRVKDQLLKIDSTYTPVKFSYTKTASGETVYVKSLEEIEHSNLFRNNKDIEDSEESKEESPEIYKDTGENHQETDDLQEGHFTFEEFQTGITLDKLFGPYLKHAKRIVLTDPYIRAFFQIRNLMEFIETIVRFKNENDEVEVHLITKKDDFRGPQQEDFFMKIQDGAASAGIEFTWEFDSSETIHARHIVIDDGWKILLDRGLDIYQHYEMNDAFSLENRLQQYRKCKQFEVTYIKNEK